MITHHFFEFVGDTVNSVQALISGCVPEPMQHHTSVTAD